MHGDQEEAIIQVDVNTIFCGIQDDR
jgi:hypothetical protein